MASNSARRHPRFHRDLPFTELISLLFFSTDHWFAKCVHATAHIGRVPRCLSRHGAHGREPVPGHSNGSRSRANVVFALSDAVRHQTLTYSRHHSQGELRRTLLLNFICEAFPDDFEASETSFFFAISGVCRWHVGSDSLRLPAASWHSAVTKAKRFSNKTKKNRSRASGKQ